jgi:hypothetical protein
LMGEGVGGGEEKNFQDLTTNSNAEERTR